MSVPAAWGELLRMISWICVGVAIGHGLALRFHRDAMKTALATIEVDMKRYMHAAHADGVRAGAALERARMAEERDRAAQGEPHA